MVLTLTASLLSSCAFREDDVEEERRENTKQVIEALQNQSEKGELNKDNVSASFLPLEIGKYQLVVKWPSSIPKVKILVNDVAHGILARSEGYEFPVDADSQTRITLTAMNDLGNEISMYAFVIDAPPDLVVDSEYYFKGPVIKIARLHIKKTGTIITGNRNITIETDELLVDPKVNSNYNIRGYIDNAHIKTYNGESNLRSDEYYSSGTITIKVLKKASGQLSINSTAADGRDGEDGVDAKDTTPGSRNGADEVVQHSFFAGGRGPDRNSPPQCTYKVVSPAQKGKDGIAGSDGSEGIDGDDSPRFVFDVYGDYENFSIYMLNRPGKGGSGGLKGKSIPPGLGGMTKKRVNCSPVDNGRAESGKVVPDALDGKPGKNGEALGLVSNLPQYKTKIETYIHQQ